MVASAQIALDRDRTHHSKRGRDWGLHQNKYSFLPQSTNLVQEEGGKKPKRQQS